MTLLLNHSEIMHDWSISECMNIVDNIRTGLKTNQTHLPTSHWNCPNQIWFASNITWLISRINWEAIVNRFLIKFIMIVWFTSIDCIWFHLVLNNFFKWLQVIWDEIVPYLIQGVSEIQFDLFLNEYLSNLNEISLGFIPEMLQNKFLNWFSICHSTITTELIID